MLGAVVVFLLVIVATSPKAVGKWAGKAYLAFKETAGL